MRLYLLIPIILLSCSNTETYVEYHENDSISITGVKINGLKENLWIKFDSLGNKIQELEYDSGILVKRRLFIRDTLIAEEEMKGENNKNGLSIFYFADGSVESYNSFENGNQLGKQEFFYKSGIQRSSFIQTDTGIVDFEQYHKNGSLMVKAKSLNNGSVFIFDSLGNKEFDLFYKNGVLVDTLKVY